VKPKGTAATLLLKPFRPAGQGEVYRRLLLEMESQILENIPAIDSVQRPQPWR
jgi:hypothetical protein